MMVSLRLGLGYDLKNFGGRPKVIIITILNTKVANCYLKEIRIIEYIAYITAYPYARAHTYTHAYTHTYIYTHTLTHTHAHTSPPLPFTESASPR
jgi:hypothetical protein